MKVIVAGTVAIDDIKTPNDERKGLMGGSASYAAMASSFSLQQKSWGSLARISQTLILRLFKVAEYVLRESKKVTEIVFIGLANTTKIWITELLMRLL